ncbi:hypothetical protein BDV98DRAFT_95682 [Pterulicium gracile]|uniref:Uncharacterized protein n=1 Tax=Pterulicium gracile TaxID=1884261 RepID=A0A5C3QI29_9AGAR|nr:hypothetical protein BDV98DRAFT_95682 [Pterula gracilis]
MKPTFLPSAIKVLAVEPAQEQRSNTTLPGTCTSAQPLPVHTSRCPAAPDVQHDKTCEAHESLDPSPCTKRSGSDSHARSPAGREEATLSCFSGSRQSVDSLSPSPLPHSVPSIDAPTIVDQGFAEKTAAVDDGGPSHIVPGSAQGSTQLVFEAFSEESIKALIVPAREAFETSPESYALPDHRSSTAILPPQLSANAPIALKQDSTRTKAEPGASPLSLSFSPSFKGRRELALVQQDNSNTAVLSASPHAEVLEASPSSCAPSERRSSTPVPPSTSFQFQADEDRAQDAPTPVVPFDPPTRRHKEKQFLISHESSATADSPKSSRYVGPSTPISPPSSIQNSLQTLSPAVNEVAQHLSSHVVFGSNETRQATRNEDHAVTRPTQICKALGTQESTTEAHRQDACGDKQASPREPPPQTTVSTGPRDTPLPAQSAQQYLRSDSDILSPAREGRAIATTHNGSDALPAILTSAKSPSSALSIDLIERVSDLLSRHSATEGDELPSWAPIGQLKALLTCIGGSQDDISDTTESAAVSPTQDSNPRDPFMSWNFRGANMSA